MNTIKLIRKPLLSIVVGFIISLFFAFPTYAKENSSVTNSDYSFTKTSFGDSLVCYIQTASLTPQLIVSDDSASISEITESVAAPISINAGAWNELGVMNYTYSNGKWHSIAKDAYIGDPLMFLPSGKLQSVGYNYASLGLFTALQPQWVVTGFNAVIYDTWAKNVDWNTKHDRTFIGQLQDGTFIAGVATEMSYQDMYDFAKSTWGNSIRILYNLDGGDSSNMYIEGQTLKKSRDVRSVICFIPKKNL